MCVITHSLWPPPPAFPSSFSNRNWFVLPVGLLREAAEIRTWSSNVELFGCLWPFLRFVSFWCTCWVYQQFSRRVVIFRSHLRCFNPLFQACRRLNLCHHLPHNSDFHSELFSELFSDNLSNTSHKVLQDLVSYWSFTKLMCHKWSSQSWIISR